MQYVSASLPDFNTLKQMAQQDPAGLERLRQEKINELIENAPNACRNRLRGLQFQIDSQRRLSKNPMQACLNISRMMHNSFYLLREKLNEAAVHNNLIKINLTPELHSTTSAKIIAFPSRN